MNDPTSMAALAIILGIRTQEQLNAVTEKYEEYGVPATPTEAAENMQMAIAEVLPPPPTFDYSQPAPVYHEYTSEEMTQMLADAAPVEPAPETPA